MAKVYGDRPPQKYRVRLLPALPAMRCERLLPTMRRNRMWIMIVSVVIVDHLEPVRHRGRRGQPVRQRGQSGHLEIVLPGPHPMH